MGTMPQIDTSIGHQITLLETIASGGALVSSGGNILPASIPITLEAEYTAAQTNTAIVTAAAAERIFVTRITTVVDRSNTVDVGYRVGFGLTTTPTTTGVVSSHPGLSAGSGVSEGTGVAVIGAGAVGEDLRITCEVPTTGAIRVVVTYYLI